jgi:uncharacterized protein YkwD
LFYLSYLFAPISILILNKEVMKFTNFILTLMVGISAQAQPTADQIAKEINLFREGQGLTQAVLKPGQCKAAQLQAEWIATTGITEHVQSRPANGKPLLPMPWDRGNLVGVTVVAENLFEIPKGATANQVVAGWIGSPGHRANMLYAVPAELECQLGIAVVQLRSNPNWIIVVMVIGDNVNHKTGEIRN